MVFVFITEQRFVSFHQMRWRLASDITVSLVSCFKLLDLPKINIKGDFFFIGPDC